MPREPSKGDLRAVLRGISRALESSRGARDLAARSRLQGCAYEDPDHTWAGIAVQYADGRCDGFLQTAKVGDRFPIGYYREDELLDFERAGEGLHHVLQLFLLDDGPDLGEPPLPDHRDDTA